MVGRKLELFLCNPRATWQGQAREKARPKLATKGCRPFLSLSQGREATPGIGWFYKNCEELFKLLQHKDKENMFIATLLPMELTQRERQEIEGEGPTGGGGSEASAGVGDELSTSCGVIISKEAGR